MTESKNILFICLGNICRSPIAEAVFNHYLKKKSITSWQIDSAGIGGWHSGNSPDYRARNVMKKYNIEMNHAARQITKQDFENYDIIFGMDHENISDLERMAPKNTCKAKFELFGSYDPQKELIIRDPYYDDDAEGFEKCYEQCVRCTEGFLANV